MSIYGIGIDVADISRMKKIIQTNPAFVKRVLTKKELELFEALGEKRQVEFFAGRFACKEAFSKAWGTGIGVLGLQDIEILNERNGKPVVTRSPFEGKVHVSISHSDLVAVGQIVLEE